MRFSLRCQCTKCGAALRNMAAGKRHMFRVHKVRTNTEAREQLMILERREEAPREVSA